MTRDDVVLLFKPIIRRLLISRPRDIEYKVTLYTKEKLTKYTFCDIMFILFGRV